MTFNGHVDCFFGHFIWFVGWFNFDSLIFNDLNLFLQKNSIKNEMGVCLSFANSKNTVLSHVVVDFSVCPSFGVIWMWLEILLVTLHFLIDSMKNRSTYFEVQSGRQMWCILLAGNIRELFNDFFDLFKTCNIVDLKWLYIQSHWDSEFHTITLKSFFIVFLEHLRLWGTISGNHRFNKDFNDTVLFSVMKWMESRAFHIHSFHMRVYDTFNTIIKCK